MTFNKNRSALCALVLGIALACTACSPTKEDVSKYTKEKNTEKLFDVLHWADSESKDNPAKTLEIAKASIDALIALDQESANKTLIDKTKTSKYKDLILQKYAIAHGDFLVARCQEILKADNNKYEISELVKFHDLYYEADSDTVNSIFVSKYMTILAALDLDGDYENSQADSKLEICYQSFGNGAKRLKSLIKEFKFYSEGTSFSKAIKDQETRCADADAKITAKKKRRQEIPMQVRALQATVDRAVQREYMARGIQSALRLQEEYTEKALQLTQEFWNIDNDLADLRRIRDKEVQKLESIKNKRKIASKKLAFIGGKLADPYGFISALNNNDTSFLLGGKLNKEGRTSPKDVMRLQFGDFTDYESLTQQTANSNGIYKIDGNRVMLYNQAYIRYPENGYPRYINLYKTENPKVYKYIDDVLGVSFRLSSSMTIAETAKNGTGVNFKSRDGQVAVSVNGCNSTQSLDEIYSAYDDAVAKSVEANPYSAKGGTWFVRTWTSNDKTAHYVKYLVKNNKQSSFHVTIPSRNKSDFSHDIDIIEASFRMND